MKKRKKLIAILIVPCLLVCYIILLLGCYLFEPSTFDYADLSEATPSFDAYDNFSYEKDPEKHIKKITPENIVACKDKRLKYSDNTITVVSEDNVSYNDMEKLAYDNNAKICGYIKCADFYQFEFTGFTYDELCNVCDKLISDDKIRAALPDYFEETPLSDLYTEEETDLYDANTTAFKLMDLNTAWQYTDNTENIKLGMIDGYAAYTSSDLNIANKDHYSITAIEHKPYRNVTNHGTFVASEMGAYKGNNVGTDGLCPGAKIYSYIGINNTNSYWMASICDMVYYNDVKAINISMGYNTHVSVSAALGNKNALEFIEKENMMYSAVLEKLIDKGKEFVICIAAGNSAEDTLYKDFFSFFGYGEKKLLGKLDFLKLLDTPKNTADAGYALFMAETGNEKVESRVITVGSVDLFGDYSSFSTKGTSVDIAAPGERIIGIINGDNDTDIYYGTSMATPWVTATAGLMFDADPSLTGAEVKDIIVSTASKTATDGVYTYKILNAGQAVKTATERK